PPSICMAAVAMVVRGQRALAAIPASASSAERPSTHMLIPYLAIVYARCPLNQRGARLMGGERTRMWGFLAFWRCGMQAWEQAKVPRAFAWFMRSKRFMGVLRASVRLMALALFTRISMPPNVSTVLATASRI